MQRRFAHGVASLVVFCSSPTSTARANPSDKIVKNLATFVCQEVAHTAVFASAKVDREGILSLRDAIGSSAAMAGSGKGKGAKDVPAVDSEEVVLSRITRRGAHAALARLAELFGRRLFHEVPKLRDCLSSAVGSTLALEPAAADAAFASSDQLGQDVLDNMTTLATLVGHLDGALYPDVLELLPAVLQGLQSGYAVIRQSAARCVAAVCAVVTVEGMRAVIERAVPFIGDPSVIKRQGAVELVSSASPATFHRSDHPFGTEPDLRSSYRLRPCPNARQPGTALRPLYGGPDPRPHE
jgi:TATA-binding protein-associated factor